jgi:hypothetical protein
LVELASLFTSSLVVDRAQLPFSYPLDEPTINPASRDDLEEIAQVLYWGSALSPSYRPINQS